MESLGDQGQAPDLRSSHFWWGETRPERTGGRPLSNFRRLPDHLQVGTGAREANGEPVDGSLVVTRQQETRKHFVSSKRRAALALPSMLPCRDPWAHAAFRTSARRLGMQTTPRRHVTETPVSSSPSSSTLTAA